MLQHQLHALSRFGTGLGSALIVDGVLEQTFGTACGVQGSNDAAYDCLTILVDVHTLGIDKLQHKVGHTCSGPFTSTIPVGRTKIRTDV
jgi:hypothetical protein